MDRDSCNNCIGSIKGIGICLYRDIYKINKDINKNWIMI